MSGIAALGASEIAKIAALGQQVTAGTITAAAFEAHVASVASAAGLGVKGLYHSLLVGSGPSAGAALSALQAHATPAGVQAAINTIGGAGASAGAGGLAATAGGGVAPALEWGAIAAESTAASGAAGGGAGAAGVSLGSIALYGAAALVVIGGAIYMGTRIIGANDEADRNEAIAAQTSASAAAASSEAAAAAESNNALPEDSRYFVVQVTNHPSKAIAVVASETLDDHEANRAKLHLCDFLHGGRCEGSVVDTPNGAVTAGPSPEAQFGVLESGTTSDDAYVKLCRLVSDVRPASLAEGFVADYRGETVTLSYSGFTSPCP